MSSSLALKFQKAILVHDSLDSLVIYRDHYETRAKDMDKK